MLTTSTNVKHVDFYSGTIGLNIFHIKSTHTIQCSETNIYTLHVNKQKQNFKWGLRIKKKILLSWCSVLFQWYDDTAESKSNLKARKESLPCSSLSNLFSSSRRCRLFFSSVSTFSFSLTMRSCSSMSFSCISVSWWKY